MRLISAALTLAVACSGCNSPSPTAANTGEAAIANTAGPDPFVSALAVEAATLPPIDTIEITAPSLHATIKADGSGNFLFPKGAPEPFAITAGAFRDLEARLAEYRAAAVSKARYEKASRNRPDGPEIVVTGSCAHWVANAGKIGLRWTGRGVDDRSTVDLRCDAGLIGAHNRKLVAIVATLPRPKIR